MSTTILNALAESPGSPLAREEAARLVEAYISHYEPDDAKLKVVDVERPWAMWLDDWTLLVGVKDIEFDDGSAIPLMGEWKTRKEPQRTIAGKYYKGQAPEDWLASISNGPQLGIYALHKVETTGAEYARIMVRAAVKSTPVELWPPDPTDGIFILNRDYLMHLRSALLVRGSEIRSARLSGRVPWDWVGYKCQHMYGSPCVFFESFCKEHRHPTGRKQLFSAGGSAGKVIADAIHERGEHLYDDHMTTTSEELNRNLVIITATSYENYSACRERGRIIQDGLAGGDESFELQVGSMFHAALAAHYRGQLADTTQPSSTVDTIVLDS